MSDRPPIEQQTIIHIIWYAIEDLMKEMDEGTISLKAGQEEIKQGLLTLAQLLHDQIDEIPGKTREEVRALFEDADSLMNGLLSDISENTAVTNSKLSALDDYLRNEIGYNIANMTADIDGMRDNLLYIGETLTKLPENIAEELSGEIVSLQNGITSSIDSNTQLVIKEIQSGNQNVSDSITGLKTELSKIIQSQTIMIVHSLDSMTVVLSSTISKQFETQNDILDAWKSESIEQLRLITEMEAEITEVQIMFFTQFWGKMRDTINSMFEFDPAEVAAQMVQIIGAINMLTTTMGNMSGGGK